MNADLIWMPSPLTKVEFFARSEIDETTLETSLGAIDRFYKLSLQHAFWRYLILVNLCVLYFFDFFRSAGRSASLGWCHRRPLFQP